MKIDSKFLRRAILDRIRTSKDGRAKFCENERLVMSNLGSFPDQFRNKA
jgi:hypothetical protein